MLSRGLTAGTAGNISSRFRDGMLITPTRVHPEDLCSSDIVFVGSEGQSSGGQSTEWRMHVAIYRVRSDVAAVAHTHSPHAISRSFTPAPVIVETEERAYIGLQRIAVAPHAPAGSVELAEFSLRALGSSPAALLARHGVVSVAKTPRDAVEVATIVEHQAQIALLLASRTSAAAMS
jgi:L-fuculose-phosphate aldolase